MKCRTGCAACCIAPSISSPIPGMPQGKGAGERCVQLTADNLCRLFGTAQRPAVCTRLRPAPELCGESAAEAMAILDELERLTRPPAPSEKRGAAVPVERGPAAPEGITFHLPLRRRV